MVLGQCEKPMMNLGGILLSIFWFMILFAWIWLLISILGDIFRDHDLSGWGKASWTLFLIVIPWLGALVYLIACGRAMKERALDRAQQEQQKYAGTSGRTPGARLTRSPSSRTYGTGSLLATTS